MVGFLTEKTFPPVHHLSEHCVVLCVSTTICLHILKSGQHPTSTLKIITLLPVEALRELGNLHLDL